MKIFRYFALLFTFPFISLLDVSALESDGVPDYLSFNYSGYVNNNHVYEQDNYDEETKYSNHAVVSAGNEVFLKIYFERYSLKPINYLVQVSVCSTSSAFAAASTPMYDFNGAELIKAYKTNSMPLNDCYVGGYTGKLYLFNYALSVPIDVYTFSQIIWSGTHDNYNQLVKILNVNVVEYTNELAQILDTNEKASTTINQNNTIINQNDTIINKQDDTNKKLDEAENTRKGIWGTIKDVLSNIIALPKKIVEFLVDALKDLFIPTEEQISEVIDDSKELSENFGFVGEGVSFSVQLFTSLLNISQSTGCVDFPEFSLDFTNVDSIGHKVKFWDKKSVCLADNQWFGSNSNGIVVVRSITTILLIVVFLNFCYKAFFRVLSKESGD